MLCSGADTEMLEFGAVKRCRKENPTRFFLGAESESETQLNHMHRDTERERERSESDEKAKLRREDDVILYI